MDELSFNDSLMLSISIGKSQLKRNGVKQFIPKILYVLTNSLHVYFSFSHLNNVYGPNVED